MYYTNGSIKPELIVKMDLILKSSNLSNIHMHITPVVRVRSIYDLASVYLEMDLKRPYGNPSDVVVVTHKS